MKFEETLSFDDVLIKPQYSSIQSRKEVDISTKLGNHKLWIPLLSAPMDTITETDMGIILCQYGGLPIVHRYNTINEQCKIVKNISQSLLQSELYDFNLGAAVGMTGDFIERTQELLKIGCRIICIDVAHGDHELMGEAIQLLKNCCESDLYIIAGNVATKEGAEWLAYNGANAIKVGIGGGSICETRINTGHGIPTFQSVLECSYIKKDYNINIIADGGHRTPGDIIKSIAAGADAVMLGSMFAGTLQTPGKVIHKDGKSYKEYSGMASEKAQKRWKGTYSSQEGISSIIPYKGHVDIIIEKIMNSLRSGYSYSGTRNIKDFQSKAIFVRQSNASIIESDTHILKIGGQKYD